MGDRLPAKLGQHKGPAETLLEGYIGGSRDVNTFVKLDRIGEGTYGTVYKAQDKKDGRIVALKKVKMDRERDGLPMTAVRELKLLRRTNHPNIVQLLDVAVGKKLDSMFYIFEYCEHDLALLVDNRNSPFSESEVKCIMMQLLDAVAYLHENWIIHRDLKLSNLLFNNKGQLKLCDFGLAREYGEPLQKYTTRVITLWYRPPELILGTNSYGTAVDQWGIGCIFGELFQNAPLLPGKTEAQQLEMICKLLGTPTERIWPGFLQLPYMKARKFHLPANPYNELKKRIPSLSNAGQALMNGFLTFDPNQRISARDALQHDYFKREPLPKRPDMMPTFPTSHPDDVGGQPSKRQRKE